MWLSNLSPSSASGFGEFHLLIYNPPVVELVVFDWNGTVIADTSACMAADNHVVENFGGNPVDLRTYRETIIIPGMDFYVRHGCSRDELLANPDKLGNIFHDFYEPRASRLRTRAGARAALSWLQENQIPAVILSNHTVEGIEAQLQRLRLSVYFKEVVANSARNSSFLGRNKREKLEAYMDQNQYCPSNVVIVGDSPEELEIARCLGLVGVAITEGYYARSRLYAAKPDHTINNIGALVGVIEELNTRT